MKTLLLLLFSLVASSVSAFAAASPDSSPVVGKPLHFWQKHILLANLSHLAAGFGLALLLRAYVPDKPAVKAFGWLLLAFAIVAHLFAFLA